MRKNGEVKELRLPLEVIGVELDERALGVFVNLLSLGSKMTVRGLFVNGHVMSVTDLIAQQPGTKLAPKEWLNAMLELVEKKIVGRVGDVFFILNPTTYYGRKTYPESVLTKIIGTVRQTEKASVAEAVTGYIQNNGVLKPVSNEDIRNEILALYAKFGEDKNAVQSYIGLFRTAKQIQDGARMSLPRHLKAVKSFYEMYQTKQFTIGLTHGEVSRERLLGAIRSVVERKLSGLSNHNYIKTMFKNGYEPNQQIGQKSSGKTDEGYSRGSATG